MFHYLANERLQLSFFSPNVCAAFLGMSVLLCIGFFWFSLTRPKWIWKIAGYGIVFPLILLQFIMLATTYSRGGYVACVTALLAACIFSRRKWNFLFPAQLITILLLTGDGMSRIQSIGNLGDGSIRNRFLLWEGGSGIIARHWLGGVHCLPRVGESYTFFYQPLWLEEGYLTLISDPLTIAAQYGIFVLFLIAAIVLFVLQQGGTLYRKERNPLLLYACAAVLSYLISGLFSTCYRFGDVTWLFWFAMLIIGRFVVRAIRQRRMSWSVHSFWPAPALAAAGCAAILVYGAGVNAALPYAWEYGVTSPKSGQVSTLTISPRGSGNGFHILLPVPELELAVRQALRPLALAGFTATALKIEPGVPGIAQAEAAIWEITASSSSSRYVLLGIGEESAVQVLALATRMEPGAMAAAAVADAPFDWPFDELSPRLNVAKRRIPLFFLCHSEKKTDSLELGRIADARLSELPAPPDARTTGGEVLAQCLLQLLNGEIAHED